ncbi:RGS domain-containing protein [Phycomyces nitens]|nr:RGS domain-containing protein [Phycomyces nitens]
MHCQSVLTLESILQNPSSHLFHCFSEYLKRSFCHENLVFWMAVQQYKDDASAADSLEDPLVTHPDISTTCHAILTTHIYPNAPQEINIPCDIREDIIARIRTHHYTPTLFVPAADAVLELMRANSFVPWTNDLDPPPVLQTSSSFPDRWHLKQFIRYSRTSFTSLQSSINYEDSIHPSSLYSVPTDLPPTSSRSVFKRMKRRLGLSKPIDPATSKRTMDNSPRFPWIGLKKSQR